mgnify:CR=1 FL=1
MKESCSNQVECCSTLHTDSLLQLVSSKSNSSQLLDHSAKSLLTVAGSRSYLEENLSFVKKNDIEQEQRQRESRYNTRKKLNYVHGLFERNEFYDKKENKDSNWKYKDYYVWKHRTGYCHRRQFDSSQATSLYTSGKIENMFKCGTAQCVSCAKGYFCQKHQEIQKVLTHYDQQGIKFYMVTLTISHNEGDTLAECSRIASAAKTKLMKHRVIKDLDCVVHITRREETIGLNSWHVHYHMLMGFDEELLDFRIHNMKNQWIKICSSLGNVVSYENGLDVKLLTTGVSGGVDYVCKEETLDTKKAALEVASVDTKHGRQTSYTVSELISLGADNKLHETVFGKDKAEQFILEYYGVKNKKTFQFSKTYKACLEKLTGEDSGASEAEEILDNDERIEIHSVLVYQLMKSRLWNKVLMANVKHKDVNDMLAEIWEIIENSDFEEVYNYEKTGSRSVQNFIKVVQSSTREKYQFRRTILFKQNQQLLAA